MVCAVMMGTGRVGLASSVVTLDVRPRTPCVVVVDGFVMLGLFVRRIFNVGGVMGVGMMMTRKRRKMIGFRL